MTHGSKIEFLFTSLGAVQVVPETVKNTICVRVNGVEDWVVLSRVAVDKSIVSTEQP